MKTLLFVGVLGISLTCVAQQTPKLTYPTDDQVELLITQAERAVNAYEAAVHLEGAEFGPSAGAEQDHEVAIAARQLLAKLKKSPQGFNTAFGFVLIIDLDDASRNMAVCMSQASNAAMALALDGKATAARAKMAVGRTCMDNSQLLYTVSESATQLYENYQLANSDLQDQVTETLQRCSDVIKAYRKTP